MAVGPVQVVASQALVVPAPRGPHRPGAGSRETDADTPELAAGPWGLRSRRRFTGVSEQFAHGCRAKRKQGCGWGEDPRPGERAVHPSGLCWRRLRQACPTTQELRYVSAFQLRLKAKGSCFRFVDLDGDLGHEEYGTIGSPVRQPVADLRRSASSGSRPSRFSLSPELVPVSAAGPGRPKRSTHQFPAGPDAVCEGHIGLDCLAVRRGPGRPRSRRR